MCPWVRAEKNKKWVTHTVTLNLFANLKVNSTNCVAPEEAAYNLATSYVTPLLNCIVGNTGGRF